MFGIGLWSECFICLCFDIMENLIHTLHNRIEFEKEVKNHNSREYRYYIVKRFVERIIWKWKLIAEDIELNDIINYLVYYKTTPIKRSTNKWRTPSRNAEYNVVCWLRTFFKYCCVVWKRLKFNREQIPIFKQDDVKRDPMSKEDYELLHQAIRKYSKSEEIRLRDELMIEIPRETWLRKSEIVRCRFKDFHSENRQFKVLVKWNRYEAVFFSEKLQKKVFKYEKLLNMKYPHIDIEKLFVCLWQKEKWKEMSPWLFWKHFTLLVKRMKSDWMIPKSKRLCLHMERHSFAMRCVYSWLSQQETTALMRHRDPKITLHYYHMNNTRLLNQYDLIS